MGFERDPQMIARYETVARLKSTDEICAAFRGLLVDHFHAQAHVDVPKTTLRGIAQRMAVCEGGHAGGAEDDYYQGRAYDIGQSLDDKFDLLEGPTPDTTRIKRRFVKGSLKPYLESRYWNVRTNQIFCIAAGMGYEDAQYFCANLMGLPWLYLRDPDHVIGDFCLRFGLGPAHYAALTARVRQLRGDPADHQTQCTALFVSDYEQICRTIAQAGPQPPDALCAVFETFAQLHYDRLFGNFQRAQQQVRDLIGMSGLSKGQLAERLAETALPWEFHLPTPPENGDRIARLFGSDIDLTRSVRRRIDVYCRDRIPADKYIVMRADMIRLLLLRDSCGIRQINRMLEDYGFFPLDPRLPFDFLVLSALLAGTYGSDGSLKGGPYERLHAVLHKIDGRNGKAGR